MGNGSANRKTILVFAAIFVQLNTRTVVLIGGQLTIASPYSFREKFFKRIRSGPKVREIKVKRSRYQYFNSGRHRTEKITAQRPWSDLLL